ncbi:right-handed parallel beta-helix repeat-containing protein [Candidatus Eisenbacteria bacterium]|uniref:Right-handed parallel beta-helix repeat-containing protein n=1 Tax=Eiseniibacteriota bacterium TaxID=2212470 RepID=A0ABV6YL43_UNCEI
MHRYALIGLLTFFFPLASLATTYSVCPDGSGDFNTIQAAIDASTGGEVIELCDAIFSGDGNRDLDFGGREITVRSLSGNPEACIIDCGGTPGAPHRAFNFHLGEGHDAVLHGVTIRNGYALVSGGGIICDGSSPSITDCVFEANHCVQYGCGLYCAFSTASIDSCIFVGNGDGSAYAGGGMSCINASPSVSSCSFVSNSADTGGGLHCAANASPSVTFCTFMDNEAVPPNGFGGGLFCFSSGSPDLADCTFEGNTAVKGGGVSGYSDSDFSLTRCILSDNSAQEGGGIHLRQDCTSVLIHCTFSNNTATTDGGGMWCRESAAAMTGCTLSGNSAWSDGGGMYVFFANPTVENTIIAFSASGAAVHCVDPGSSPSLSCCDVYGNAGGDYVGCIATQAGVSGNISLDPFFCDAATEDYRLEEASPCAPFTDPNAECDLIGAWPVGCGDSAVQPPPPLAAHLYLEISPNPFSPATRITYEIPQELSDARVQLALIDPLGRLVRILVDERHAAGQQTVTWDGHDESGRPVGGGLYLVKLKVGDDCKTRRLLRLP